MWPVVAEGQHTRVANSVGLTKSVVFRRLKKTDFGILIKTYYVGL